MILDPFCEERLGYVYFLSHLQALIVSFLRLSHVNSEPESRRPPPGFVFTRIECKIVVTHFFRLECGV